MGKLCLPPKFCLLWIQGANRNKFALIAWNYWGVQKQHRQSLSNFFLKHFPSARVRFFSKYQGIYSNLGPFRPGLPADIGGAFTSYMDKICPCSLWTHPIRAFSKYQGIYSNLGPFRPGLPADIGGAFTSYMDKICPCSLWTHPIRAFRWTPRYSLYMIPQGTLKNSKEP